ncbi:transporter substrate-binding domain-containing protein [Pseudomonas sp. RIT-PI-S]|uniref:PAS domain-containing sensor histidine kinase n=1 Tax=Pseudomonas sp. RIT-PI-S TaxID=3035295 RepID=UPI0021D7F3F6|nr:transporter substrate-binding domain-containing protein [Pseudomonas sp. RIT-PI-S]
MLRLRFLAAVIMLYTATVLLPVLRAISLLLTLLAATAAIALPLDPAQREWLAQHPQWRAGVVLQSPYAQLDRRSGRLTGLNIDLINALAQRLEVEVQWRPFNDQPALEQALRKGDIDLAPGLLQTPAGLRLWDFSDPYLRNPQRLIAERGAQGTVDLETVAVGTRVAVRGPGAVADYLRSTYPNLDVVEVPQERRALEQLEAQRVAYAVLDDAQLGRLSREAEFASLAVVGDIGLPQLLRIGTPLERPRLRELVQAGLQAIPAKALEQWRERWLQPGFATAGTPAGFWRGLGILASVLLVGLAVAFGWQRRQLRHLEQRLSHAREAFSAQQAREAALRLTQFSIDQSTVGIFWVNWDSHLRYANGAAERLLGYAPGALVDRPLAQVEPGLSMDRWLDLWKRARAGEEAPVLETRCRHADGSWVHVDVALSFLRHDQEEYLVVFLTDVSERRRAQAQLRELAAHLESVREEEKARIAREVHDELGQVLTVLKLEVSMCELGYAELDAPQRQRLQPRLDSMKRLIAQLFKQVRDVATALRPPILDAGLASAIEWQATRFEGRTGIPCLVQLPEHLPALSDAKATGLFRILQEALTNVMRHANAHSVEVRLSVHSGTLRLSITDDGSGFEPDVHRPASFGLVGMRERVMLLGGQLALQSRPGEGTSLYVRVPLNRKVAG